MCVLSFVSREDLKFLTYDILQFLRYSQQIHNIITNNSGSFITTQVKSKSSFTTNVCESQTAL